MSNKLLLLTRENEQYRQLIESCNLPELTILGDSPNSILEANIWFAEPALALPLLGHANELRWMQSTFAGVDKLMGKRQRKDYQLTNVKGIFGPLMSEYVFGYLLSHQRQHDLYQLQQQQKLWLPTSFKSLQGQNLLLLGTGSIAQHIAVTAKHFGMTVTGINRQGRQVPGFDCVDTLAHLDRHLVIADAIVSVLPSTTETAGTLNRHALTQLKHDAVLFNIGRGDVLDLNELTVLLDQRPQMRAILDVFNQEPLPSEHPIWECQNAVITPHIAAPSFPEQVVEVFSQNYQNWLSQKPLDYVVEFERGY
ncbi:D-2-hydroxyacid dehydrogenase [Shewanella sp. WXL01]|uniref:D-2-hydroxyacid dehydrogenase n=1 Tax=Shewanella sp. WXL01 TaxID=2709721 RepID=UPI00143833AF|nr:D-2-hydroxyacid dehydrogenase [Shewanella sp. WXL01]NKF49491.1 D-2-hydroxyacid dehydrogenase [Shewanella sp. WXL01]